MTPEMFRKLAVLGLSHEQMAGVLEVFEDHSRQTAEADEERKAKVRARVQKWRDKQKDASGNVTERYETQSNGSCGGDARGLDNLQTKNLTGQKENKKDSAPKALSDLSAFKADLEQDASSEQVEAFAKHRKTKKGQNSAYSAKLFRKDAEACGLSVSQAIDTAISRGWLTVKPEYLAGRGQTSAPPRQATSPPPREPRTVSERAIQRLQTGQTTYEPDNTTDRRLDQSYRPRQDQGPGVLELVAIAANGYGRNQ